ncbi:MAG: outer membrane beta-barrel protein [Desulfococcaceae bacterium]
MFGKFCWFFLAGLLSLSGGDAFGQQSIRLRPMRVDEGGRGAAERNRWSVGTTLSLSGRYEDNFFQTNDNEHTVYTYLIRPGLQLDYETAKSIVSLLYSVDVHEYQDQDGGPEGAADDDDFIGHTLALNMETSPTPKLTFRLEDSLLVTREENKADRFTNEVGRDRYFLNRFTPGVHYRLNDRFSAALSYTSLVLDYKRDTDQDSVGHRGMWEGYYDLSPTAAIGLNYQYWQRDYDVEDNDYAAHQGELTFNTRGKFIELEAGAGYQNRDFDAGDRSSEDTFNYRFVLSGRTADTPMGPRSYLRLGFGQNFNNSGLRDDFFEALQFEATAGHVFRDRLLFEIEGLYLNADYPQQTVLLANGERLDREDDRYQVNASIAYQIRRWMDLVLTGGYENRDSNLPNFDFDSAYVQLALNAFYDLGRR